MSTGDKFIFEVRTMTVSDVPEVAALHTRAFPGYFLTHMGQAFLRRFYNQFVEPSEYAFVAVTHQAIIGFVVGTTNSAQLFNRFYRNNFFLIVKITMQRLIVDGFLRKEIIRRSVHIPLAVKAFLRRSPATPTIESTDATAPRSASLKGIGVDPDFRGAGVADELVRVFCDALSQDGVEMAHLTVRPENARAIRFYERTGWKLENKEENSIGYFRPTRG